MRPEARLLLCCARTSRTTEENGRIGAIMEEEIDWDHLLRMARGHGMVPLLYWHLGPDFSERVPPDVLRQLRDHYHANNLRNLLRTRELVRMLGAFEAGGVPAVPYKGPALAAAAYGNLALREFVDVDVLIHKRDVHRARDLMVSLGYRQQIRLTGAQEAVFLQSQREYVFERGESVVELHWALAPRIYAFPLDPERLWGRLDQGTLENGSVPAFSPEDLLLILCVHGSKHLWHRLAWICDVAEHVRVHEHMDWEWLVKQARALGGERMLLLGLFLAGDLLGTPLPEVVRRGIRADPMVKTLAGQVKGWLFWEADEASGNLEDFLDESAFHPFRVKMRERLQDKVRYCARVALTPELEDWELLPLPRPLFPLYYVLRPARLAGKYGRRMLERVLSR